MKRMKTWMGIRAGGVLLLSGCDDVFETDLTGCPVRLLAPGDSVTTVVARQLFLWEPLEGATAYRLRIATPDFCRPEACLLDTLVAGCRYEYAFQPGVYTWGIRAENSAWAGEYAVRLLIVSPLAEEP